MNSPARNPGVEPAITFSADEVRWERVRSDAVEPQRVRVAAASGEWKVARCPWWLDAAREGDELVLRVRHCGRHRGKVRLRSKGGSASIRVQADIAPAREHARAAKRRGVWAALLLASPPIVAIAAAFTLEGQWAHNGEECFPWLFACWAPLATVGFGRFLGSWKLAVRTALGVGVGVVVLSALIATEAKLLPAGGFLPRVGYHVRDGYYTGALRALNRWDEWQLVMAQAAILVPPHLALFWAIWGAVSGGRWLARKSALWGTLWSVPLLLPFVNTGYAVFLLVPFALVLVAIAWQRTLGGLLARIPYGEEVPALLARSARDKIRLRWMTACLLVLVIASCEANDMGLRRLYMSLPMHMRRSESVDAAANFLANRAAAAPGTVLWEHPTGPMLRGPAVSREGVVYYCDGPLHAFDPRTGRQWQVESNYGFHGQPFVGPDGTVHATSRGYIHAFSSDGKRKWSFKTGGYWADCDAAADGMWRLDPKGNLYVSSYADLGLIALDQSGRKRWTCTPEDLLSGEVAGPISLGPDGTIYRQRGEFGHARKLDMIAADGALIRTLTPPDAIRDAPVIAADGTIYAPLETVFVDVVVALDPQGAKKWEFDTDDPHGLALGADGTIYFSARVPRNRFSTNPADWIVGSAERLYALHPDGTLKWHFDSGDTHTTPVVTSSGRVYLASGNGYLYALDAANGRRFWVQQIGEPTGQTALTLGPDGDLYLATTERKIIAVKAGVE